MSRTCLFFGHSVEDIEVLSQEQEKVCLCMTGQAETLELALGLSRVWWLRDSRMGTAVAYSTLLHSCNIRFRPSKIETSFPEEQRTFNHSLTTFGYCLLL